MDEGGKKNSLAPYPTKSTTCYVSHLFPRHSPSVFSIIYIILFFSDDLFDKVMRSHLQEDHDVKEFLNRYGPHKPQKLAKIKKAVFTPLARLLRVFGKWLKQVPVICFAIGLIQMMEYEVTLDTVRGNDFKLIEASMKGRDLTSKDDIVAIKNTINALTSYSGRALFPIAILSPSGCFENGDAGRLCKKFMTEKAFSDEVLQETTGLSYGVSVLKGSDGASYMFSVLPEGQGTLVGKAGAYSSSVWGRAAFLEKLPYYLSRSGLRKMYSKSKYIWAIISFMGFVFILTREVMINRNRILWLKGRVQLLKKNKEISKALGDLNEARSKSQAMEAELELQITSSDILKQEYNNKLENAQTGEKKAEELYFETLESLEEQLLIIKKQDAKLNAAQSKHALEEARTELNKIKRLWTYDYGWNDRFEIERDITPQGNSPFIRNVSFVGFEIYIKKLAREKLKYSLSRLKAHDGPNIIDLIDELAEANMISEKDKNFFHEVRIARNNWMHEWKLPSEQLLKRLVNKLEKSNPVIRPVL